MTYEHGDIDEVVVEPDRSAEEGIVRQLRETIPLVKPRLYKPITGVVIGELIGIRSEGRTPLVLYPDQPGSAAIPARTVVDLDGQCIGCSVVLMFEDTDPGRPIIMGILRTGEGPPLVSQPEQVELVADGERLIVSAKEQVVIRCGKAHITLTKAGKIIIEGTYVLSRSSGVNRVKGGSVQIN
jgi:hypothetical protein